MTATARAAAPWPASSAATRVGGVVWARQGLRQAGVSAGPAGAQPSEPSARTGACQFLAPACRSRWPAPQAGSPSPPSRLPRLPHLHRHRLQPRGRPAAAAQQRQRHRQRGRGLPPAGRRPAHPGGAQRGRCVAPGGALRLPRCLGDGWGSCGWAYSWGYWVGTGCCPLLLLRVEATMLPPLNSPPCAGVGV